MGRLRTEERELPTRRRTRLSKRRCPVIRSWLGHASTTTTNGYIEIDVAMKRTALETCAAMPIACWKSSRAPRVPVFHWLVLDPVIEDTSSSNEFQRIESKEGLGYFDIGLKLVKRKKDFRLFTALRG
jgi:hypothetical protein